MFCAVCHVSVLAWCVVCVLTLVDDNYRGVTTDNSRGGNSQLIRHKHGKQMVENNASSSSTFPWLPFFSNGTSPFVKDLSSNETLKRKDIMTEMRQQLNISKSKPKPGDVTVGCKELRSKRYLSDGFCTSIKPITEVVCVGSCLPIQSLPWYAEFVKVWARTKVLEWRCVDDEVRRQRVTLQCENGDVRTYRVRVVRSCKCKRHVQHQQKVTSRRRRHRTHRRRLRRDILRQQSDKSWTEL